MRRSHTTTRKPVSGSHPWPAAVVAALLMTAAAPALAQQEEPEPAPQLSGEALRHEVAELVAALGSSDVRTRIGATEELRGREDLTLASLEEALAAEGLSAEQRQRLASAAMERFFRGPRAAMGVQWRPDPNATEVVLQMTVPGFHSSDVLEPGDRLEAIAGTPVTDDRRLRATIISHDPGETVEVALVRQGEPMRVQVRLGNFDDLHNGRPDAHTFATAWAMRAERRRAAPDASVLDAGLAPDEWLGADARDPGLAGDARVRAGGRILPGHPARGDNGEEAALVAGGEARLDAEGRGAVARRAQQFQIRIGPDVQAANNLDEARQRRQHLDILRQTLAILDQQVSAVDQVLENPATGEERRGQLLRVRQDMLSRRVEIELEIRVLEDQGR